MNRRQRLTNLVGDLPKDAISYFFPDILSIEESLNRVFEEEEEEDDVCGRVMYSSTSAISDALLDDYPEEPEPIDYELDSRTKAIIEEVNALCDKHGVTVSELIDLLDYSEEPSRLRITRDYEIILEDYGHRVVKMDTLTKAVFILFLKHPEGIRYKCLSDHALELERIYESISWRSDRVAMRRSIRDLTESVSNNSINEKVSRVKKAFRDVVDDHIAQHYYIDGYRGEAKRISLSRSLVIWEI